MDTHKELFDKVKFQIRHNCIFVEVPMPRAKHGLYSATDQTERGFMRACSEAILSIDIQILTAEKE